MGALCCKPEVIDFDGPVDLYHFYLLRAVGKGAFGKVRVVQHKQTKNLYALKYINKAKCIKMRAVSNIIQERRLLEEIDSPFVCNLRYAFQDDENMFMVLDLMLGGDLRFHLDRTGNMSEDVVRFYVAELALGLDYLHRLQIVHRDLKPDNVLLDAAWAPGATGLVRVTDFGIASVVAERERTTTGLLGTPQYMAPEAISHGRSGPAADVYGAGVMLYELLAGRTPFAGPGTDFAVAYRHVTSMPPVLDVPGPLWSAVSATTHTCDRRSNKTFIETLFPSFTFEPNFPENDPFWSGIVAETSAAQDSRSKRVLDDLFAHDANSWLSITSHSGEIRSLLRVLGHREFSLGTGAVIPVLVEAKWDGSNSSSTTTTLTAPAFTSTSFCTNGPQTTSVATGCVCSSEEAVSSSTVVSATATPTAY